MPQQTPDAHVSAAARVGSATSPLDERLLAGTPGVVRTLLVYLAMVAVTLLAFFAIRWLGESQSSQPAAAVAESALAEKPNAHVLGHVLLALAAVIALGRVLGGLLRWIGQPPVIGEVLAGILLGPSFLGAISPAATQALLPATALPYLGVLAQIGVIVYMFVVGMECDADLLADRGHAALAISHASILAPFVSGALLATSPALKLVGMNLDA